MLLGGPARRHEDGEDAVAGRFDDGATVLVDACCRDAIVTVELSFPVGIAEFGCL